MGVMGLFGQQPGAEDTAVGSQARLDDIIPETVFHRRMNNVAAQCLQGFLPDFGEDEFLLHDAAAENDLLRREGEDRDGTKLGKVVAFQLPGGMGLRQFPGGKTPFFLNGGAGGHAFQAAAVIGADTLRQRIAG